MTLLIKTNHNNTGKLTVASIIPSLITGLDLRPKTLNPNQTLMKKAVCSWCRCHVNVRAIIRPTEYVMAASLPEPTPAPSFLVPSVRHKYPTTRDHLCLPSLKVPPSTLYYGLSTHYWGPSIPALIKGTSFYPVSGPQYPLDYWGPNIAN